MWVRVLRLALLSVCAGRWRRHGHVHGVVGVGFGGGRGREDVDHVEGVCDKEGRDWRGRIFAVVMAQG